MRFPHNVFIDSSSKLLTLCNELRVAGAPVAIDTEFMSEKRYFAKLCLIQIFCDAPRPIEAVVDPFTVDLHPLLEIISDAHITKIVHAGGQDLQIFQQNFDCSAHNVWDTQIAAAFLGYGHQAGLADLVKRVLDGPQLSKKFQFTDWAARPLSPEQTEYALDDVRYLPRLYAELRGELEARGRVSWAQTEFERAEAKARTRTPGDEIYQKLNLSGLSRRGLGVLRELAQTRDALAREIDKPPSFLVPDLSLTQMAKHPPQSLTELRATRGVGGMAEKHARALLEAAGRAVALPNDELPQAARGERPDEQQDAVAGLLGVVIAARAADDEISRSYLAPRDQVNTLAAWWLRRDGSAPPDIALLADWRREIVGDELLDLLDGKLALIFDNTPGKAAIKTMKP